MTAAVTVIIPTTAESARALSLQRAVMSVRASSVAEISIIVVVNGARADQGALDWLGAQADIMTLSLATAGAPLARLEGLRRVITPFVAFLDDDDEYLDGATDMKVARLREEPSADVVVTNGFRNTDGSDRICYPDFDRVIADPLKALFGFAWLNSCNSLFRTATIGVEFFEQYHPYIEWTWLAYLLTIRRKKVVVLNAPTFRINNSPQSVSKTSSYGTAHRSLFDRMLASAPNRAARRLVLEKIGAAHHDASEQARQAGLRGLAWSEHLASLGYPGRFRYLAYTRLLLRLF